MGGFKTGEGCIGSATRSLRGDDSISHTALPLSDALEDEDLLPSSDSIQQVTLAATEGAGGDDES